MSKKINDSELDSILKDIYDTKIPEDRQFAFKGETNINTGSESRPAEGEMKSFDISADRRRHILRQTVSAAASLVLVAGLGFTVFRNTGLEKNPNIHRSGSPAASEVYEPETGTAFVTEPEEEEAQEMPEDISETDSADAEPQETEFSEPDFSETAQKENVWDYFDREYIYYPEGYSLEFSVSSGSRTPYLVMSSETDTGIFKFSMNDRNMERVCDAGDYAYSISPQGELFGFYRDENGDVLCNNFSAGDEPVRFSAEYVPAYFTVLSNGRKLYLDFCDGAVLNLVFFDYYGNRISELSCPLAGDVPVDDPYNPVSVHYIGTSDGPKDTTIINYMIGYGSYLWNGFCQIDADNDVIQVGRVEDDDIFSYAPGCGVYGQKLMLFDGTGIYGVLENDTLSANLDVSAFYDNRDEDEILDYRYTEEGIYFFFRDHAEKVIDLQTP